MLMKSVRTLRKRIANSMRTKIKKSIFAYMKSLNLLLCGSLVVLLGCAGSTATKQNANADATRAKSSQAFDELESGAVVKQPSGTKTAQNSTPNVQSQSVDSRASLAELLQSYACPNADDLRGVGFADDASAALALAQKDISAKIQSVVVAKTEETRRANIDASGNETIQSSFEAKTQVFTQLQNAQDAKSIATLTVGGKFGVAACMAKADAAKPFIRELEVVQDSVMLALKIFEEQKHPIIKNNAFKAAQDLYARTVSTGAILAGLGVASENKVKEPFEVSQKNYNDFRAQYAFYYQAENVDASVLSLRRAVFERLSAKYSVRSAECKNGLLLKLEVSPAECGEGSLGISCVSDLYLSGSSCEGDSYFGLQAKVKGAGRYDVNEAKKRLNENISKGDWFNEWIPELDKWRLE